MESLALERSDWYYNTAYSLTYKTQNRLLNHQVGQNPNPNGPCKPAEYIVCSYMPSSTGTKSSLHWQGSARTSILVEAVWLDPRRQQEYIDVSGRCIIILGSFLSGSHSPALASSWTRFGLVNSLSSAMQRNAASTVDSLSHVFGGVQPGRKRSKDHLLGESIFSSRCWRLGNDAMAVRRSCGYKPC